LTVEDNVTFLQMLKESLCPRLSTMEIEEEVDGAYLEGGLIHYSRRAQLPSSTRWLSNKEQVCRKAGRKKSWNKKIV
jgi:hypothetical protein